MGTALPKSYAMSGTHTAGASYATSGTDIAFETGLCSAMSGIDIAYGQGASVPCPVLTSRMVLPALSSNRPGQPQLRYLPTAIDLLPSTYCYLPTAIALLLSPYCYLPTAISLLLYA
eukprot:2823505-Rhodomonas_salina.1